jgi:hypothetical protein
MMKDEERRQTAPRADFGQAADATSPSASPRSARTKPWCRCIRSPSMARPSGAGVTQDETPEAVKERVEGVKERTG